MIQNRIYLGHLAQGKTRQSLYDNKSLEFVPASDWHVTENAHEPIVSAELWEAANAVEAARRKEFFEDRPSRDLPENLFRSFLVCGCCGSKLVRKVCRTVNPSGKAYESFYYICPLNHQHPENRRFPMARYETVYDAVFPVVSGELRKAANLGAVIEKRAARQVNPRAAIDAEISRSAKELERLGDRLAGLYEDHVDRLLDEREYVRVKAEYERKADALRERMEGLSRRAALISEASSSDNRWLAAARAFQNPTELTREMLEAIAEHITVSGPGMIVVGWKHRDELALLEACAGEEALS